VAGITPKGTKDDGTRDKDYEEKVQKLLDEQIARNPVGQVILKAINDTEKDLTIVPLSKLGDGTATCNAFAASRDKFRAAPQGIGGKGATGRNIWYDGSYDDPRTPKIDERFTRVDEISKATGGGSDTKLYFTPGEARKSTCSGGGPASQDGAVLLHELVHCLRRMQGQFNPVPTVNKGYDNEEEFLAIVVTNVYLSAHDRNAPLRADHVSDRPLQDPLNKSAGFVKDPDNWRLLSYYSTRWGEVFWELERVSKPVFNPFREALAKRFKEGDYTEP